MESAVFGLDAEGIVERITTLATEQAAALELSADASDAELEAATSTVLETLLRDRKLRRHLRNPRIRAVAEGLAQWEVIVAAVGPDSAEARYDQLTGREPADKRTAASSEHVASTHLRSAGPGASRQSARRVARRRQRLGPPAVEDPDVVTGLSHAIEVEPTPDDDPRKELGYEHAVWLEDWLELAVGETAFDGLEAAVAEHPQVIASLHEDREQLFVAAPSLHPEDVRTIVAELLAPHFDPDWEARA